MSFLRFKFLSNPTFLLRSHSHSHPVPLFIHNADDAVTLFNRMLLMRPPPPIIEFHKILDSLVKMKHYPTAISLSQQMEFRGIEPNLVTFNILLNCYCHLGQMTFAFSVLGKILKRGYQPDTITLTTLIKGLCLNGEVRKALHFHDHAVAHRLQLNHISYGTLINGLCKVGETTAALQLLRWIEGQLIKPNVEFMLLKKYFCRKHLFLCFSLLKFLIVFFIPKEVEQVVVGEITYFGYQIGIQGHMIFKFCLSISEIVTQAICVQLVGNDVVLSISLVNEALLIICIKTIKPY